MKSARVSEKLVSPGLPGLQVAMRLYTLHIFEPRVMTTKSDVLRSNLSRLAGVTIQPTNRTGCVTLQH